MRVVMILATAIQHRVWQSFLSAAGVTGAGLYKWDRPLIIQKINKTIYKINHNKS